MKKKILEVPVQGSTVVVDFSAGDSEGARRATGDAPAEKSAAEPEVVAHARRRQFSVSYKRGILREAEACNSKGAIGALLRREGLYSSHLTHWRKEEADEIASQQSKRRGPKPNPAKANDQRLNVLEKENEKLRKKLNRAEQIIDVQKKLCDLLGLPTAGEVS